MKMIFTGKVSGEKTVLTAGARHTVKAQAGEQYGLVDEVTGLVPDGVEADRSGDDLILRKKEDDTEIRIEGFWEECQPGETQCTAVFNVVGENGQVTEAVLTQDGPVLENFTAGQSGTLVEGINNGIIWGGIAFGAGLAAIALAAGGGGGSSRHKRATEDEQKPVQPEGGQEAGKTDVSSTGSIEPESGNLSGRVTDQDGNGKADAEEAAVAFYERALPSNVSGDLYPQPSIFGDKVSSVSKNWSTLLDSNPGSYVTSQRLDSGANQYNYNGHTGSDVISITDSFGGLDRTQVSRFPVGLFTGEGNDLIVTGRDYGRNTSAGYTDHSHRTDMGNGDDTLVVGVGNNDVTLYVNEEGQLRATTDSYNGSTSIDYTGLNSSSSGGTISGTDIVMGAGNDTVLALGYEGNSADAIINTNIDLGAGNDFIYANGEISTNNGTQVNIIGGEGFDTISLDNTTVTSAMFSGFEHVDLHSTSHLILNSDDFKSQDIEGEILKISGSSGASVDVQNFDWENLSSANDGDVKYFTYQSTDIPGLTLWIQEGIEVK
ncbi:TPA: hypothetical protein ACHY3N_004733 [Escherichia coli]|uniref:hypothetical protein n=1 Tax=Escherichia coli TaxID=562 RepID=UPI0017DDE7DD|nr:hypothetical protein [Escherichia coli]EEQ4613873.1 hypothetical protein [Escherichia coli]EEY7345022.1 hypothetical protein [Escherichia coli]EEZ0077432.1 hypothetical protein [Escherichia coli]EFG9884620.1 hypothetical protein [Escherichia coli]EGT2290587.1 hypothetical protein [Escherichia coli]